MTGMVLSAVAGLLGAVLGDLLSEEVRRRLDLIPLHLMRLACTRLPEPARSDRADEWAAELDAILVRRGATKLPVTRLVVGLRFALGLLIATPAIRRSARGARQIRVGRPAGFAGILVAVGGYLALAGVQPHLAILLAEIAILAIMARFLISAFRHQHRSTGAAALVLSPVALLFLVGIIGRLWGPLPAPASIVTVTLLVWQPYFAVRFSARVRPMPRTFTVIVGVSCAISAVTTALQPRPLPPATVAMVIGFSLGALLAVAFALIAGGVRRRSSEHPAQMAIAGLATMTFGIMMVNLGLVSAPGTSPIFEVAGKATALVATCGYLIAVLPPKWMRLPWPGLLAR